VMAWRWLGAVIRGDGRAGLDRSALLHRKALLQPGQVAGSPCFVGQGQVQGRRTRAYEAGGKKLSMLAVLNLADCVAGTAPRKRR